MEYMAAQMDRQIEGAQVAYEAAMQAGQEPAFPTENAAQTGTSTWRFQGMSLRDYFAAQAINGLMAMIAAGKHDLSFSDGKSQEQRLAVDAYRVADAMLAARAQ